MAVLRRLVPLLVAIFSTAGSPLVEAVPKPTGVFSSSGAAGNAIYANPTMRGVLVRVPWSSIEPTPGVFDLRPIDEQVRNLASHGLGWSLAVLGGGTGSPGWLVDQLGAPFVSYSFRGVPGYRLPLFWDPLVQHRLTRLAEALGAAYGESDRLALVYVTQMTSNGIEGHLQGVALNDLLAAGYTEDKWVEAAKSCARSYAAAFMNKAIAIEVHDLFGSSDVPSRIIHDLWNEAGLEQRVGAAMWWLSGSSDYQNDLIRVLSDFPGDIYGQVIGKSEDVERFGEDDYTSVFRQARQIGIRYLEPWEYEFKTGANSADGAWNADMAAFNQWADATYPADGTVRGRLGPPEVTVEGDEVIVRWLAIRDQTYTVLRSTDLAEWPSLREVTATASDWVSIFDSREGAEERKGAAMFYRIHRQDGGTDHAARSE